MNTIQESFMELTKIPSFNAWDYEHKFHNFDYLALEYQRSIEDKRRGEIAQFFVGLYEPMVKKRIGKFIAQTKSTLKDYYHEEGLAIWNMFVCECLQKWTGKSSKHDFCSFHVFLFNYADKAVSSELQDKYAFKDMRYSSTDRVDGSADMLNAISNNDDAFRTYEAQLLSKALKPTEVREGCFEDIIHSVDAFEANKEFIGMYDTRNDVQWEAFADTFKHVGEELSSDAIVTGRCATRRGGE